MQQHLFANMGALPAHAQRVVGMRTDEEGMCFSAQVVPCFHLFCSFSVLFTVVIEFSEYVRCLPNRENARNLENFLEFPLLFPLDYGWDLKKKKNYRLFLICILFPNYLNGHCTGRFIGSLNAYDYLEAIEEVPLKRVSCSLNVPGFFAYAWWLGK